MDRDEGMRGYQPIEVERLHPSVTHHGRATTEMWATDASRGRDRRPSASGRGSARIAPPQAFRVVAPAPPAGFDDPHPADAGPCQAAARVTDATLVSRCLAGDEAAWAALIDRYKRLIFSIPLSYGASYDDASDIFQAVCVDLVTELATLRKPEALKAWLVSVTKHKSLKRKRQSQRTQTSVESDTLADTVPDQSPDVASVIEKVQREQSVRDAMTELPGRCRELVRLLFFVDPPLPYATVAARLGLATGSIGFIRGRCLKKLDAALKARGA